MVYSVGEDRVPQNVTNRHRSGEEFNRAIEVLRFQLSNSCDSFLMNAFISWGQGLDGARTLDVRRFRVHGELAAIDAVADIRVTFGQVPRQLTQRPAAGVRAEVVLRGRQGFQKLHRIRRLSIPGGQKRLELIGGHKTSLGEKRSLPLIVSNRPP